MEQYSFENTLEALHNWYSTTHDTIELYTAKVKEICFSSLRAAQVRHSPITSRIKTWESAKRKIEQKKPDNPSLKDMITGLHDFGGIRISVYFPGDVDKVAEILQDHLHTPEKPKRKKPGKKKSKKSSKMRSKTNAKKPHKATFGGYRATHIMVQLKDSEIPQDKVAWKDVQVEVQIATLVMNVWSEIEHDMIYKPLETLNQKISEHERRLLDLINGIVMTGEVALQQLEASTAERLSQGVYIDHAVAFDWYGLAVWIADYHRDKGIPLSDDDWYGLKQLHGLLKARGYNQHRTIYDLLDTLYGSAQITTPVSRKALPNLLLKHLCERDADEIKYVQPQNSLINYSRDLGHHLLYSLSIAIYLGIGDRFLDITQVKNRFRSIPSLVDFLDIMHPTRPIGDKETKTFVTMSNFCRAILDQHSKDPDLSICIELSRQGLITHWGTSKEAPRMIFPSLLLRIFPLRHSHHLDHENSLQILESIDEYIYQRDQSTPARGNDLTPRLDERPKRPLDRRFFLPTLESSHLKGRWQLVDIEDELELKFVPDWKDEYRLDSVPPSFPYYGQGTADSHCDALQLAYRLYPGNKSYTVFRAWQNACNFLTPAEKDDPLFGAVGIKREASPILEEQHPQRDEPVPNQPLPLPSPRGGDATGHEASTGELSIFSIPTNKLRASDKVATPEPYSSVRPPRTRRSATPRPLDPRSNEKETSAAQYTAHGTFNQTRYHPQAQQRTPTASPPRAGNLPPFPEISTSKRRRMPKESSEENKRRKLDR